MSRVTVEFKVLRHWRAILTFQDGRLASPADFDVNFGTRGKTIGHVRVTASSEHSYEEARDAAERRAQEQWPHVKDVLWVMPLERAWEKFSRLRRPVALDQEGPDQ